MRGFNQPGNVVTFTAPGGGVVAGAAKKIGDILTIPQATVAAGLPYSGLIEGVVEVAKVAAQVWTEGQQINWDNAANLFTNVTTGNFKAGVATAAAANPSATGFVRLSGVNLGAALP